MSDSNTTSEPHSLAPSQFCYDSKCNRAHVVNVPESTHAGPTLRDIEQQLSALAAEVERVKASATHRHQVVERIERGVNALSNEVYQVSAALELLPHLATAAQRIEAAMTRAVNLLERAEQWTANTPLARVTLDREAYPSPQALAATERVVRAARSVREAYWGVTSAGLQQLRDALDALDAARKQEAGQ